MAHIKDIKSGFRPRPPRPKRPQPLTKKQRAKNMFKILIQDEELMYELNVLLRNRKIKKIQNGRRKT